MIWLRWPRSAASRADVSSSALRMTIVSGSAASGMRAAKVPDCGNISMSPSSASLRTASRTGVRLKP